MTFEKTVKAIQGLHEKNATLTLSLKAKSGYTSVSSHKISPDQWNRICVICEEK